MHIDLSQDTAIVTGGGTGLGFGIAQCLVSAGAQVVITGRREEPLRSAQQSLGEESCLYMVGDVTSSSFRKELLLFTQNTARQPLSILINNAGNHLKKPAEEVTDSEFQSVMETHVNAGFALARDSFPIMKEQQRGHIVFLASMASYLGVPQVSAYTAAKCAVVGLTRALASEWSSDQVRVNAIAPGWIDSPMLQKALSGDQQRRDKILGRTPMNCFGEASDIGTAITFFSSHHAKFITGQVLPVDGGASIGF